MPRRAPLEMRPQDLRARPVVHGPADPLIPADAPPRSALWRISVFGTAFLGTGALLAGLFSWLHMGGMTWLEWALLALIGLSFLWVSLSVSTVMTGLAGLARRAPDAKTAGRPLRVALLVPIYNENTSDVFGNARAMLDDLARVSTAHSYALFVLSDTQDETIILQEMKAFQDLVDASGSGQRVYYRRRADNIDKKAGNIHDWVSGWGGAYEAMLVLDADSLMTGRTIVALSDELAADDRTGLVQSFPTLIGAETLFARTQQFANIAYGWLLAEGLALWSQSEGNYWGHNAILRTRAFASSAGLPRLRGDRLILSHDFVEAGLMRRAGWKVRFLPRLSGSFEETPATLVDHALRDRRWCRGNLQHLRLLGARGLHPVSRFHLFHGAVSYLLSPAWFLLLLAWALLGKDADSNVITYFREDSPLYPDWPVMTEINAALFLAIMYAVLLTPKLTGAAILALHPKAHRLFGGRRQFLSAVAVEITMSILYAPVMMVQQCRAVLYALIFDHRAWAPQNRTGSKYRLTTLMRFHWLETVLGLVLAVGLAAGLISLWLLPIVTSLLLAVPLSALGGLHLGASTPAAMRLETPNTLREPGIVSRAKTERLRVATLLASRFNTPAE